MKFICTYFPESLDRYRNRSILSGPKRMVYIDGIYEKDLTPGGSGEETKHYFADGRRVAARTGSTLHYLANDHLGSTAFVMNATGGLESHVRYYPYGMTWSQSATPATDRLFTGHQQMGAESGTYYANARFYSADIGRFPEPDPFPLQVDGNPSCGAGVAGQRSGVLTNGERIRMTDPRVLNGYAYVINNPTNYTDTTGQFFGGAIVPWFQGLQFAWDFTAGDTRPPSCLPNCTPTPTPVPTPTPEPGPDVPGYLDCLYSCGGGDCYQVTIIIPGIDDPLTFDPQDPYGKSCYCCGCDCQRDYHIYQEDWEKRNCESICSR